MTGFDEQRLKGRFTGAHAQIATVPSSWHPLASPLRSVLIVVLLVLCVCPNLASADTVTHYGDFGDTFGAIPIPYSSETTYVPGDFVPLMHEGVASIPKFDASLGTLTDITVFVDPMPTSPIFYTIGGTVTMTKDDAGLPDYGASLGLLAEIAITYGDDATIVLGDEIELAGGDMPPMGSLMFTSEVVPTDSDGMFVGSTSIIETVDLADFVGPGIVDALFVDFMIEETADFAVENATATASLGFDVFDSDSGLDDAVIGVTYTFTPVAVPEPSSIGCLTLLCLAAACRRRR